MPQVQESVLEHTEEETRPDAKSSAQGVKAAIPSVHSEMLRIPMVYEVPAEIYANPELICNIGVTLPSGHKARFILSTEWHIPT